jgi:hypothetical protein
MKPSLPSLLCVMVFGLALTPAISLADYQPAETALEKLENIVTLTPAQEKQALQIYQNLKDIMDSMSPADRAEKGAQSRQDALAAIRAILTPDQQAIYDATPQRLGGDLRNDPVMMALNRKIRVFVVNFAKTSPQIAAQVGSVQRAVALAAGSSTTSDGDSPDPAAHPSRGVNQVRVIGSSGTKIFRISWTMDASGEMTVTMVEDTTK